MAQNSVSYLAYGSNLHPERIAQRVGEPLAAEAVSLAGWSIRFHKRSRDGSGKCDIIPASGQFVHGVIYTLTRRAKQRLDLIEGAGFGYSCVELAAPGVGTVATYRAVTHVIDGTLKPYSWYHQLVVEGARHHGLPADYVASLAAVATVDDPDQTRHRRESRILISD